jgi:DNA-binding protein H-NS
MNEFLKVLSNVRSLRAALRELSFPQLQEAKEKFDVIYQEYEASSLKDVAAEAQHKAKLAEFHALLKDAGIDPSELVVSHTSVRNEIGATLAKRAPRPAKYKYQEDGQERTWTGQGRMPKAIAKAVESGLSLDTFLI